MYRNLRTLHKLKFFFICVCKVQTPNFFGRFYLNYMYSVNAQTYIYVYMKKGCLPLSVLETVDASPIEPVVEPLADVEVA